MRSVQEVEETMQTVPLELPLCGPKSDIRTNEAETITYYHTTDYSPASQDRPGIKQSPIRIKDRIRDLRQNYFHVLFSHKDRSASVSDIG